MRNRNIFIRKESEFSCNHGNGFPVFANVTGFFQDRYWDNDLGKSVPVGEATVLYSIDYPEPTKGGWRWHYGDTETLSGTYVKPLEEFLARFTPDVWDEFGSLTVQ